MAQVYKRPSITSMSIFSNISANSSRANSQKSNILIFRSTKCCHSDLRNTKPFRLERNKKNRKWLTNFSFGNINASTWRASGIWKQTSFMPFLPIRSLFFKSTAKFRRAIIDVWEIVGDESVIFSTRIGRPVGWLTLSNKESIFENSIATLKVDNWNFW